MPGRPCERKSSLNSQRIRRACDRGLTEAAHLGAYEPADSKTACCLAVTSFGLLIAASRGGASRHGFRLSARDSIDNPGELTSDCRRGVGALPSARCVDTALPSSARTPPTTAWPTRDKPASRKSSGFASVLFHQSRAPYPAQAGDARRGSAKAASVGCSRPRRAANFEWALHVPGSPSL